MLLWITILSGQSLPALMN